MTMLVTPLNVPIHHIWHVSESNLFKKGYVPLKMPLTRRDVNKFNIYHKDVGHNTKDFQYLKQHIYELIYMGYLKEFVKKKEEPHQDKGKWVVGVASSDLQIILAVTVLFDDMSINQQRREIKVVN